MQWLLGLPLALTVAGGALAGEADQWLTRMADALSQTDYQGTLVYLDGSRMETLKVYRSARDSRERLVVLTGSHREIVRDGDTLICIGAGDPTVAYEGSPLAKWEETVSAAQSGMLSEYELVLGDVERVAGYDTQVLALRPHDAFRYGYRLWLESETGLPLRIVLEDGGKGEQPLEQLMFTEVQVGVTPTPGDLRPSIPDFNRHYSLSSPATDAIEVAWTVSGVPAGFVLRSQRHTQAGDHLVYSDGLASVSVYIEPRGDKVQKSSASRAGAVHARAFTLGDQRVFVIGKVPAATIERFARGVVAVDSH